MELYTAEKKVRKLMEANPTIPEESFGQLVNEKFGIKNNYFGCNMEVEELEEQEESFLFYKRQDDPAWDHITELDFENRGVEL